MANLPFMMSDEKIMFETKKPFLLCLAMNEFLTRPFCLMDTTVPVDYKTEKQLSTDHPPHNIIKFSWYNLTSDHNIFLYQAEQMLLTNS